MEIERDEKMTKELRVIPKKNYIILTVVVVVTILLTYYFYMWVNAYNENKINKPILDKYMEVINYNELDNYITENPNSIIYVSVLENEKIRNFEKKLKNVLKNKEMDSMILYLDITDDIKKRNVKKEMIDRFSINSISMVDVPCVLVIKDGKLNSIYSVTANNYSVDKFENFIDSVGEIND